MSKLVHAKLCKSALCRCLLTELVDRELNVRPDDEKYLNK